MKPKVSDPARRKRMRDEIEKALLDIMSRETRPTQDEIVHCVDRIVAQYDENQS